MELRKRGNKITFCIMNALLSGKQFFTLKMYLFIKIIIFKLAGQDDNQKNISDYNSTSEIYLKLSNYLSTLYAFISNITPRITQIMDR